MKSYLEKCKIFKPSKEHDASSTIDITDDSESLMEEILDNQKIKSAKLSTSNNNKNIEIFNVRQLPSIFFIIFIVVLAILVTKFVPHVFRLSRTKMLYKTKFELKYVAEIIGEQNLGFKIALTSAQFILMFIIICLTSLIRQRISVPELKNERWRNYLILISGTTSILSMITLLYYNQPTLSFTRNYFGFIDNIIFTFYLISSFIYSCSTYILLAKMNIQEIPKDCACLLFKKYLILFMGIQLICYLLSVLLVTYYNPIINQEKFLLTVLILCFNINCILYFGFQALFIFSLKYDLYYVNMNLQIRPDLEYFLDLTENNNLANHF